MNAFLTFALGAISLLVVGFAIREFVRGMRMASEDRES